MKREEKQQLISEMKDVFNKAALVVVALNKTDINEKKKTEIDVVKLSKALKCDVVETISTSSTGLKELIDKAISLVGTSQVAPYQENIFDISNKEDVIISCGSLYLISDVKNGLCGIKD